MWKRHPILLVLVTMALFFCTLCSQKDSAKFDILIINGKVIDGTGNPWFYGDIGIKGNTIIEIGNLKGRNAIKTIDAQELVVSPGFIDMHTHCDRGLGSPESAANLNYVTQGVTTVVTGNCGSGTFRISETKAKWENQGIGTNAVLLVGHGTIRSAAMGMDPRNPTPEELEKMKSILHQAMKEGAWGMSTGLEYVPGRYADTEELVEITKVINEFGGIYSTHKRTEQALVREAVKEVIQIATEADVRANISHLKICGKTHWGLMKDVVKLINDARAEGIYVVADMYPYDKASSGPLTNYIGIPENMEPLAEIKKKSREQNLSDAERKKLKAQFDDELIKALTDPSTREQIREATVVGSPNHPSPVATWGWDSFTIVSAKKNTHLIGKILYDLASEQNRDAFDIVADLFIEERDNIHLSDGAMSEDEMKLAMRNDWLMFSSDGSAIAYNPEKPVHPRNYGSFPRVLRKYVREEGVLTLEESVRKMTSLPASLLQIRDRGLLIKGYKADLVIFDPATVQDNATHLDSHQFSTGIEFVIINGKISIENGRYNDSLNGKVLLLTENK